jgi:hypothetical protein
VDEAKNRVRALLKYVVLLSKSRHVQKTNGPSIFLPKQYLTSLSRTPMKIYNGIYLIII